MTPTETDWIQDGTVEAEPETVETPAAEVSAEPTDTIVTEAPETPEPVSVAEVVEVDEVTTEAVETVEVETVQKFIDAKLGDEIFQIPEGVLLPQKRGDEIEYVPIGDVQSDGMKGNDYRVKTTELAQGRRALERGQEDVARLEARMDARSKYLDERDKEMKDALTNPESAAAYQEHLEQYRTNPMYRKNVDAGLSHREVEADRDELQAREDQRVVTEASNTVFGWIDDLAKEYEGVDAERVRTEYSRQLKDGTASLDIKAVRSIYEAEKDHVDKTVSPLRDELAGIKAQLESLQASKAADQHNETTAHAVTRAKTTPVATGSGAPAKGYVPPGKFSPNELSEQNDAWSRAG